MSLCSSLIKYCFSLIWQDSQSISSFGHLFLIYMIWSRVHNIMNSWYDQPQIFIEASFHNYTDKEPHGMDMQPSSYIIIRFKMIIKCYSCSLSILSSTAFSLLLQYTKEHWFLIHVFKFAALIKDFIFVWTRCLLAHDIFRGEWTTGYSTTPTGTRISPRESTLSRTAIRLCMMPNKMWYSTGLINCDCIHE